MLPPASRIARHRQKTGMGWHGHQQSSSHFMTWGNLVWTNLAMERHQPRTRLCQAARTEGCMRLGPETTMTWLEPASMAPWPTWFILVLLCLLKSRLQLLSCIGWCCGEAPLLSTIGNGTCSRQRKILDSFLMHCQFAEHIMKFQANRMDNWETNMRLRGENLRICAWRYLKYCFQDFQQRTFQPGGILLPFSDGVAEESSEAAAEALCSQEMSPRGRPPQKHRNPWSEHWAPWCILVQEPPIPPAWLGEHYTPFLLLFQPHGCNSEHGQSMGRAVLGPWCCDSHQLSSAYLKLLELEHLQFPSHLPLWLSESCPQNSVVQSNASLSMSVAFWQQGGA